MANAIYLPSFNLVANYVICNCLLINEIERFNEQISNLNPNQQNIAIIAVGILSYTQS